MSGNTYTSPSWKGDDNENVNYNHRSIFYKTERWFFLFISKLSDLSSRNLQVA